MPPRAAEAGRGVQSGEQPVKSCALGRARLWRPSFGAWYLGCMRIGRSQVRAIYRSSSVRRTAGAMAVVGLGPAWMKATFVEIVR